MSVGCQCVSIGWKIEGGVLNREPGFEPNGFAFSFHLRKVFLAHEWLSAFRRNTLFPDNLLIFVFDVGILVFRFFIEGERIIHVHYHG